jgi:hypothetical protein
MAVRFEIKRNAAYVRIDVAHQVMEYGTIFAHVELADTGRLNPLSGPVVI